MELERKSKIFSGTILAERNVRRQNCLSPKGEFFAGSEAQLRMVGKRFLSG